MLPRARARVRRAAVAAALLSVGVLLTIAALIVLANELTVVAADAPTIHGVAPAERTEAPNVLRLMAVVVPTMVVVLVAAWRASLPLAQVVAITRHRSWPSRGPPGPRP
jgi:hypothetical protein